MPYPIERKFVIGVSSTALFNLIVEDSIFINDGLKAYREYQIANKTNILEKGNAFPFIRRLLNINSIYTDESPIEVVLLSKNSPETGIRIFNSIQHYDLPISRAAFTSGKSPYQYIPPFNISLFLSTNIDDVTNAIQSGYPAGRIIPTSVFDDEEDIELRVAFDFDGVIVDDESEKVFRKENNIDQYFEYESNNALFPLKPGPLADFFIKISFFQKIESKKLQEDSSYKKVLRTAIITSRNAPAHERVINTLGTWGLSVDEMLLLGGVDKRRFLEIMKPHIYFDDQIGHLDESIMNIPLVHIPFGVANTAIKHEDPPLFKGIVEFNGDLRSD